MISEVEVRVSFEQAMVREEAGAQKTQPRTMPSHERGEQAAHLRQVSSELGVEVPLGTAWSRRWKKV